jgi:hypothetical protein
MANEEFHEVVDVEKIEPKSVHIEEAGGGAFADAGLGPQKRYTVTYSLPIAVSQTWQKMFQMPDPRSGVVHQVQFVFSEDGREVRATLENEPAPELLIVLKKYAERANDRWLSYREKAVANRPEEERILKKLKESP